MTIQYIGASAEETLSAKVKAIVNGLNFMMMEAERKGMSPVAAIIRMAVSDVVLWDTKIRKRQDGKNGAAPSSSSPHVSPDLLAALELMAKMVVIRDKDLRNEVISKLEEVQAQIEQRLPLQ
jgi:hypothetical protein